MPPAKRSNIFQIHVSLHDIAPAIWRRVLVPENLTLPKFHRPGINARLLTPGQRSRRNN